MRDLTLCDLMKWTNGDNELITKSDRNVNTRGGDEN